MVDDIRLQLADGGLRLRTRVMSWPPEARTMLTLIFGKLLLKTLIVSCTTSVNEAV